ncbi:D-amino acid dehydrogenase (quinone) [Luteimicrobium xylanilyticum]|uniref:D-amino acid dehydrogenase (Quinone) n=1 Tax=Luteimicrobium xylanilyticum TaxID=1133546 RepID=A0A5P9Q5S8_9MICO|nr:FAD-dependent oxidoreductase [Luteimicrobium xylanilyticum]QFU96616.1 D-amino acid dehydrogenase (quinone) [Luteimicrobium xylanilyticum]
MRVLVIGAGVAGASVAWSLTRRGAEVVVVDRLHDGAATLAGAGIVRASLGITEPGFVEAYAAAVRHYPEAIRDLGDASGRDVADEVGYRVVGGLWLSADDDALADVEARLRAFDAAQVGTVSRLDPAQAHDAFPAAAADLAAVHVTQAARVDGRRLRLALLAAARAHGAVVHDDDARLSPAGAAAELGSGERIDADHVVVAAGTWTPEVLAPRGVSVPITPQRGQISHLGLPGTDTSRWATATAIGSSHYLLAFDDSRVVVGATRERDAGTDYRVTAAGQAEVLREALAVAPGLADATLLETRVGFRPTSPDGVPIVGRVADDVTVVTGFGASGLTLGPYVGERVADDVLGLGPDDTPGPPRALAAFDPSRFTTGSR